MQHGKICKRRCSRYTFSVSDLSGNKKRPALVIADLPGNDIILCQITSQITWDSYSIPIHAFDFTNGSLPVDSNIRPSRIFTADENIVVRKAGKIKQSVMNKVSQTLIALLT